MDSLGTLTAIAVLFTLVLFLSIGNAGTSRDSRNDFPGRTQGGGGHGSNEQLDKEKDS